MWRNILRICLNNTEERTIYFDADHYEIADFMNASDIVVTPSITTNTFKEEYGRVVPETMACGCLVIVTSSGTLKELINDDAWIFQEGEMDQLASLLEKAILIKERKEIGHKASLYAKENFGIKKQAYLMVKVFKLLFLGRNYES